MKDKNQKNQMIVLCCLVAVVLGLGVFKVMGGSKGTVSKGKQVAAIEQSTQAMPDEPSGSLEVTVPSAAPAVSETPEYAARDPFTPQVVPDLGRKGSPVSSRQTPLAAQASRLPLPMMTLLPTQPIAFGPPDNRQETQETNPVSALRLTGVVEGSCNVAIIRGEGGARYIVREGQSIDGKIVVQSISRNGVRLRSGGKTYVLTLGSPPSRKSS